MDKGVGGYKIGQFSWTSYVYHPLFGATILSTVGLDEAALNTCLQSSNMKIIQGYSKTPSYTLNTEGTFFRIANGGEQHW